MSFRLSAALLLACTTLGPAGCSGDDQSGSSSGSGTDGTASTSDGTGGSSSSGGTSQGSDSASGGSDGTGNASGNTTDGVSCLDGGCGAGEICVVPCCGGAPPSCYPADGNGACNDGDLPVDAAECIGGCEQSPCCQTTCMAADPYCVGEGDLVCGGEIGDQCSTSDGSCFGTKSGGLLECTCA